jgi:phenylacetate-CoA ligase
MLLAQQRELFRQAFGVELRDLYGSRECPWIAAECACGTRHISPRYIIEALDEQTMRAVPEGEAGLLAVTDLYARCTPFIRYLIGDLGAVAWRDCACGRRGFCLTELHGRTSDVIELPSGTRISGVFVPHLVEKCMGVQRAQVVRLSDTSFQLRYIGDQLDYATQEKLKRIMHSNFEGADAQVVRVSELQTSSCGKARLFLDLRSRAQAGAAADELQIA